MMTMDSKTEPLPLWLVNLGFPKPFGSVYVHAADHHDAWVLSMFVCGCMSLPGPVQTFRVRPEVQCMLRDHHGERLGRFLDPLELHAVNIDLRRRVLADT